MNGPSKNALRNRVNLYRFDPAQDADAGTDPTGNYPGTPFAGLVPCSAQCGESVAEVADGRVTTVRTWTFLFGADPGLATRDRIDLLAADGTTVTHSAYAAAALDGAGRGSNWEVGAEERL